MQSLYDLKQAAHDWYFIYNKKLIKLNFVLSKLDLYMYINKVRELIVLIYMNDIFIVSPSKKKIKWFKKKFVKAFKIKNLRELKKIFDIEVERDRANKIIRLSQIIYVKKILQELNWEENRHRDKMNVLMNEYDNISQIDSNKKSIDKIEYIKMIEKLMHIMMYIRSNIAFALRKLTQFMSDFFKRHDYEIKALLKYLRFNLDMPIIYRERNDEVV